jgi:hypothetical protein
MKSLQNTVMTGLAALTLACGPEPVNNISFSETDPAYWFEVDSGYKGIDDKNPVCLLGFDLDGNHTIDEAVRIQGPGYGRIGVSAVFELNNLEPDKWEHFVVRGMEPWINTEGLTRPMPQYMRNSLTGAYQLTLSAEQLEAVDTKQGDTTR